MNGGCRLHDGNAVRTGNKGIFAWLVLWMVLWGMPVLAQTQQVTLKDGRSGKDTALQGLLVQGKVLLPAEPILDAAGVPYSLDVVSVQLTAGDGRRGAILVSGSELLVWKGTLLRSVPAPILSETGFLIPSDLLVRMVSELGQVPAYYREGEFGLGNREGEISTDITPPPAAVVPSPGEPASAPEGGYGFKTVVIDPGHGGSDPGTISDTGIKESVIVLDVAMRLRTLLESDATLGVERVILTRDRDVFVPLLERSKTANAAKGDLFISLHCNASMSKHATGIETYFVSQTEDTVALDVESRENAVLDLESEAGVVSSQSGVSVEAILMDLQYMEYVRESQALAATLLRQLGLATSARERGVRQAMFYVLRGAGMPSVLVELGFISTAIEEKDLASQGYRQKLAAGLHQGILNYSNEMKAQWGEPGQGTLAPGNSLP